jgi:hypothetical protein
MGSGVLAKCLGKQISHVLDLFKKNLLSISTVLSGVFSVSAQLVPRAPDVYPDFILGAAIEGLKVAQVYLKGSV